MRVAFFSHQAFDEMHALAFALAQKRPDLNYWLFSLHACDHSMEKPKNLNWIGLPEYRRILGGLIKVSKYKLLQTELKKAKIDLLVSDDLLCRKMRKIKQLLRINRVMTDREQGLEDEWTGIISVPASPMATPNHHPSRCIPWYMGNVQNPHPAWDLFKQHENVLSDYFYAEVGDCSTDALTQFLKGYSQFKKFQKSSMKLKLGIRLKDRKRWGQLLENYAWRSEVVLVEEHAQKQQAMDGAYGIFFLQLEEGIHNRIIMLLFAKKPVVILEDRFLKECFGKGLIEMSLTEQGVAKQLMQLYKDESEQQERSLWIGQWIAYHQSMNILEAWESLMFG